MTQNLTRFLHSGDTLSRLHEQTARLQRLQQIFVTLLPDYLAGACSVANLKKDTLVIIARNGAAAAKLRQIVPSLQQGFANAGTCIGSIQIKIVPQDRAESQNRLIQPRLLSGESRKSIKTLCATLPADSPLRASLERLIERSVGE